MSIFIKNLNLKYPILNEGDKSLRNNLMSLFKLKKKSKVISALHNINLEINSGDRVGIIGKNGSGKTTLIKVISNILSPSSGFIKITGNALSVIDPNVGIEIDATGEENVKIVMSTFLYKKKDIENNLEWIKNFSELGNFFNLPYRTYSAGMKLRLTTSILLSLKPKILILDEFIGGGDEDFIRKISSELDKLKNQLDIFICASHNQKFLNILCNRFITLEKGEITSDIVKK